MPKLNEVTFYGFTRDELDAIRRHTALSGEDEFTLDFLQKVAGIIGYSISTLILTGHPITLVKEYVRQYHDTEKVEKSK